LTKYPLRVRCSFALIMMHSVLRKDAVVAARDSTLARPFCVGFPHGRHFLKGDEIVAI